LNILNTNNRTQNSEVFWVLVSFIVLMATLTPLSTQAAPEEAPPTILNGTWQLDAKRSESLSPILKKLGYGWLARKVMQNLSIKQVISTRAAGVSVRVITRFTNDIIVMPFDNRWAEGRTLDGGTTQRRSRWLKAKPALLTEDRFPEGLLTTIRLRVDVSTLHEDLTFTSPGKPVLRATRVFRRR
jgi:hypothetical protein